jgi:hypothetical protein
MSAIGEYSQISPGNIIANLRNVSLYGTNASNYNVIRDASNSISNINAVIYPKQLGFIISKIYDGLTNIISTNVSLNNIINNENVYYGGNGNFAYASAGNNISATISNSLLGNDRYHYSINVSSATGSITQKPINIVVSPITYNGTNIADINNFSITNSLIPNDVTKVQLVKSQISNFYYDSSQVGNRIITNASGNLFITGDLSKNYSLDNTQTINAVINIRGIDLSANNKVYDGSTNYSISDIILNNVLSGDNVNLISNQLYCDNKNAGPANVYLDASLSGSSSNNYSITSKFLINSSTNKIPITIMQRPVTIGVDPRTYDGTNELYNVYLKNKITGDDLNVIGSGAYDSPLAGTRHVTYTINALTGSSYNNYNFSANQSLDASINRRPVGLTILPRNYNGTSTVNISDFSINNVFLLAYCC